MVDDNKIQLGHCQVTAFPKWVTQKSELPFKISLYSAFSTFTTIGKSIDY